MTACRDSLDIEMKRILFVCTGNTCRSPMAMAVFNNAATVDGIDYIADSCGLYAESSPVSQEAKNALSDIGITLDYTSKQINEDLVKSADYIFGITRNHARSIIAMYPQYADKVYMFPEDISDPFGGNIDVYKTCLNEISDGVNEIIKKLTEKTDD